MANPTTSHECWCAVILTSAQPESTLLAHRCSMIASCKSISALHHKLGTLSVKLIPYPVVSASGPHPLKIA